MCLLTCEHLPDWDSLMYRMNGTYHCSCMGHCYHYRRMEKRPGVSLAKHLKWIEAFIHARLEEISNDCFRLKSNQALFFLLTLLGDPVWHYRINELHPKARLFSFYNRCFSYLGTYTNEPNRASGPSNRCGPL